MNVQGFQDRFGYTGSAVGDNRNPGHAFLLQSISLICLHLWMDKFQDRWSHSSDVDQLG